MANTEFPSIYTSIYKSPKPIEVIGSPLFLETPRHRGIAYRWLRHGAMEAKLAELYLHVYPGELPENTRLQDVRLGFALHDIGKIPSRHSLIAPDIWGLSRKLLTSEEHEFMCHHVTEGLTRLDEYETRYMQGSFFPPAVREILRYHHEKLDGSGRPFRIAGSDIPYLGRLAAVIDQTISRCEPRTYHSRRFSFKDAFYEVKCGMGIKYDTDIILLLEKIFEGDAHLEVPALCWLGKWDK